MEKIKQGHRLTEVTYYTFTTYMFVREEVNLFQNSLSVDNKRKSQNKKIGSKDQVKVKTVLGKVQRIKDYKRLKR